jgi:transposase, IS5 family
MRRLEELADRCEKVARQIRQRLAGEKITERIVSLADPDARPIRKGKIGKPTLGRYRGYPETTLGVVRSALICLGFLG